MSCPVCDGLPNCPCCSEEDDIQYRDMFDDYDEENDITLVEDE